MKLREIEHLVDENQENNQALKSLTQKSLFKWVSLGLVSAVIFGLSLVYIARDYQTFSSQTQKNLLVILAFLIIVFSLFQASQYNHVDTLKKAYKRFKFADLFSFISISLLIILHVATFYFITAEVNHFSMSPTLNDGDRLIVYHFDYQPVRGEIVVVYMDENHYQGVDNTHYVKRIVGIPGDKIVLTATNSLEINGKHVQFIPENYVDSVAETLSNLVENEIPDGFYFILGDNTDNSYDSRTLGFIYESDIIAKVIFRFYPVFGGVS